MDRHDYESSLLWISSVCTKTITKPKSSIKCLVGYSLRKRRWEKDQICSNCWSVAFLCANRSLEHGNWILSLYIGLSILWELLRANFATQCIFTVEMWTWFIEHGMSLEVNLACKLVCIENS